MGADASVLITRPTGQADGLTRALEDAGFITRHLPLLAIEVLDPLSGADRQRILDLDLYQHLVFVSANAARIGLERIEEYWPQMPLGQQLWAVGVSTAKVLESRGLAAQWPERDMSSEGLLALPGLASPNDERVLIVRGEGGRQLIAETLAERGARVDSLCCYRRGPVAYDPAVLLPELEADTPALIMVSSGEGLRTLSRLLQPREHTNLARITLLVPSPRVADDARSQGWQQVVRVDNASDEAMLAAAQAWRNAESGRIGH